MGQMPSVQLCVAMSFAILFHQLHSLWKPNANQIIYYVQHVALGAVELVYICGMLLLLKEPVPDGLLFGASGGTMIFGLVALGLALYAAFKKFVVLRKEDLEYEKNLNFRQNLKRRVSQLEEEKATEKNAEILDVALGDKNEASSSNSGAGTKVRPVTHTVDVDDTSKTGAGNDDDGKLARLQTMNKEQLEAVMEVLEAVKVEKMLEHLKRQINKMNNAAITIQAKSTPSRKKTRMKKKKTRMI